MRDGEPGGSGFVSAWAFAEEIRRRVLINRCDPEEVAASLGCDHQQVSGVLSVIRHLDRLPTIPRRMTCVMRDWGVTDQDIAQMFSADMSVVRCVRRNADDIRSREPIPLQLELASMAMHIDDPSPEEIARRSEEVRRNRGPGAHRHILPMARLRNGRYARVQRSAS